MSTSVDLNAPPLLPGVVSYHAVPDGPVSNLSGSIVPGSAAGDPDSELREVLAALDVPLHVATIAYAEGCRIRRVRLAGA